MARTPKVTDVRVFGQSQKHALKDLKTIKRWVSVLGASAMLKVGAANLSCTGWRRNYAFNSIPNTGNSDNNDDTNTVVSYFYAYKNYIIQI
jgi:hypothetical protein